MEGLEQPSALIAKRRRVFAVLSVMVGCFATGANAAIGLSYFFVPRGASIRPMNDIGFIFLFVLLAFILGVPTPCLSRFVQHRVPTGYIDGSKDGALCLVDSSRSAPKIGIF
jgi:hypothetical protein